jgi:hypothetical protein
MQYFAGPYFDLSHKFRISRMEMRWRMFVWIEFDLHPVDHRNYGHDLAPLHVGITARPTHQGWRW